jgi:hypothetical protein
MKLSFLLVLIAFTLLLNSVSIAANESPPQYPPPSPSKPSNPPQDKSAFRTQPSQAEQRGTDNSPFVVKTIKTEAEAAQDQKDREGKAASDWRLVILTWSLGIRCAAAIGCLHRSSMQAGSNYSSYA